MSLQLFDKRITNDQPQLINDTFTVDQSVSGHLKLVVVDLEPNSIESMFLVNPQGKQFDQIHRDLNTVVVDVEEAEVVSNLQLHSTSKATCDG